jgi:hypothetical protein
MKREPRTLTYRRTSAHEYYHRRNLLMLLNKQGQTVQDFGEYYDPTCPECDAPLLSRKGDVVVWHWAHYPGAGSGGCSLRGGETEWHLLWKQAVLAMGGQVEKAITIGDKVYRLDGYYRGHALEFVHSLSDSYLLKHADLQDAGYYPTWVLDGDALGSARCRFTEDGRGIHRLLKPRALELANHLTGCYVHRDRSPRLGGGDGLYRRDRSAWAPPNLWRTPPTPPGRGTLTYEFSQLRQARNGELDTGISP